jgi:maltooligosyltrehalose synthase
MTQRIFDVENEKDMADLWDILPEEIKKIKKAKNSYKLDVLCVKDGGLFSSLFQINWHDKKEIERPIQEATEQDAGKLCYFWDDDGTICYGLLSEVIIKERKSLKYGCCEGRRWTHCRRLTKQEIEELI